MCQALARVRCPRSGHCRPPSEKRTWTPRPMFPLRLRMSRGKSTRGAICLMFVRSDEHKTQDLDLSVCHRTIEESPLTVLSSPLSQETMMQSLSLCVSPQRYRGQVILKNRYGIFWVPPGESSCPGGSEYVWQRGVDSLEGRVTAARS